MLFIVSNYYSFRATVIAPVDYSIVLSKGITPFLWDLTRAASRPSLHEAFTMNDIDITYWKVDHIWHQRLTFLHRGICLYYPSPCVDILLYWTRYPYIPNFQARVSPRSCQTRFVLEPPTHGVIQAFDKPLKRLVSPTQGNKLLPRLRRYQVQHGSLCPSLTGCLLTATELRT